MSGDNLPLISVCIPAYNHEKYIQECIESIIEQTYQNIELIVIDDGSTDNTWGKLCKLKKQCEKRFERVLFQKQRNQGVYFTLNELRKHFLGEYFF